MKNIRKNNALYRIQQFDVSICINSFFLSLLLLFYSLCQLNDSFLEIEKFLFTIWFFYLCINSILKFGFFSVYTLFLLFNAFFIYDSFIFDLLNFPDYEEFYYITFPRRYTFSKSVANKFILYSSVFVYVLDVFYHLFTLKYQNISLERICDSCVGDNVNRIIILGMIVVYPICLYRLILTAKYSRTVGYVNFILNGMPDDYLPFWVRGCVGIFNILFLMLFFNPPPGKKMRLCMILYGVLRFILSLSGNRGNFMYSLFGLIVAYVSLYEKTKKVKLRTISIILAGCIIFSIFVGNTRNNTSGNNDYKSKSNPILKLFAEQTTSRGVPLTVIQGDIPYHNYPFIFSKLNDKKAKNLDKYEKLKTTNSIDMLTAYKIYPKSVYLGRGFGGSVLAEFIDCGGMVGVIFWTVLLVVLLYICENFKNAPNLIKPFIFGLMVNMFHTPRGYFLSFRNEIKLFIIEFVLYKIITLFCMYLRNKNEKTVRC